MVSADAPPLFLLSMRLRDRRLLAFDPGRVYSVSYLGSGFMKP